MHIQDRLHVKALYRKFTISVAAAASNVAVTVATVPARERWYISHVTITTATGVTLSTLTLDGANTGQVVTATTSDRLIKDFFGDYLRATGPIPAVVSNTGTAAADATVTFYGWRETL